MKYLIICIIFITGCGIVGPNSEDIDFSECDSVLFGTFDFKEQEDDLWRYIFDFKENSFSAAYSEDHSLNFQKGIKYRVCLEIKPWPGRIDLPFIVGFEET